MSFVIHSFVLKCRCQHTLVNLPTALEVKPPAVQKSASVLSLVTNEQRRALSGHKRANGQQGPASVGSGVSVWAAEVGWLLPEQILLMWPVQEMQVELEEAAWTLGASPWKTFTDVRAGVAVRAIPALNACACMWAWLYVQILFSTSVYACKHGCTCNSCSQHLCMRVGMAVRASLVLSICVCVWAWLCARACVHACLGVHH